MPHRRLPAVFRVAFARASTQEVSELAPQLARHALGRLPTPPPLPENLLLRLHRKLPSAPPASTQEVSESENRPATRGTAHSEVQGDARCTARCNVRPIAALHFLLPTGDSR